MATRTMAGKLDELIEQVPELEELGLLIQKADEATAADAHVRLDPKYRTWYASALSVLSADEKQKFRSEFDGNALQPRIKSFLGSPRMSSTFYAASTEDVREKYNISPWQYPFDRSFQGPLTAQKQLLLEIRARLGTSTATLDGLALLEELARKLPVSFAALKRGYRGRPGLLVNDEYDVQHILHAVLVLHFDEVETEDPTPRMAGASSRLDFLLRRERIAIETKMMRESLSIRELRTELAEDIQYFRKHPDAGALFILVYDPDRKILNATGFEADLSSDSDEFPVRIVIAS